MFKNKKLRSISLASIAFAMTSPAMAEIDGWQTAGINARNSALQQDFTTLKDDYDIWVNPAWVGFYEGRAYGALGTYNAAETRAANNASTPQLGGANLGLKMGSFGVFLGRPYTGPLDFNTIGTGAGLGTVAATVTAAGNTFQGLLDPSISGVDTPSNRFDILYGKELSAMHAGLRFNFNRYSQETADPTGSQGGTNTLVTNTQSLSATDINISAGATMKDRPLEIAATLGFPMFSSTATLKDSDGTTASEVSEALESDGAMDLGVVARGEFFKSKGSYVMATARLAYEKAGLKKASKVSGPATIDTTGTQEDKTTRIGAYGAYHVTPNKNVLVVAAVGVEYDSQTVSTKVTTNNTVTVDQETNTSNLVVPVSIGVEARATRSFTLRGSVAKNIFDSTKNTQNNKLGTPPGDTVTEGTNNNLTSAISVALGLRYTLGERLMLDAVMNRDLVFTGADLISGIPNTLTSQVSLIYDFD